MKKKKCKKQIVVILMVVIVTTLILGNTWAKGQQEEEKIFKFGLLCPISGPFATWGWPLKYSIDIAAEDINKAGGIKVGDNYYELEIKIYDTEHNPTTTATVARTAIYNDGIKYMTIVGNEISLSIEDLIKNENAIAFVSGPLKNLLGAERPNFFQIYWNQSASMELTMIYFQKKYPDLKIAALISPDNQAGHQAEEDWYELVKPLGFTVLEPLYHEPGTSEYYSLLTRLLAHKPDVIMFGPGAPLDNARIIKQARELGYKGFFGVADLEPEYYEIAGVENIEGTVGFMTSFTLTSEIGKKWAERVKQRMGSVYNWTGWAGYDTVLLLKAAIEKANSFDVDKVKDALTKVTVEGFAGPVSYVSNQYSEGLIRYINIIYHIAQIQNGEQVEVYVGPGLQH